MYFEDDNGKLLTSEEVDNLSVWEIEDRKLHVYEDEIGYSRLHIYEGY